MTRITVCAALFLFMCGEEQPAAVTVVEVASDGPTEASAAPAVAGVTHGGTVVDVGPHQMEIVVGGDGAIDAYPVAGSTPPPTQSLATVRIPADDGETHPVMLIWDPSHGAYRGRLRGAQPLPGPIEVTVATSGEPHRGNAPSFIVAGAQPVTVAAAAAPPPLGAASGAATIVVADGPPAPHVMVERPEPHVVVAAPRPARPHITVERPRPHIVLGHGGHLSPGHLSPGHGRGHGRGRGHRGRGREHGRRH